MVVIVALEVVKAGLEYFANKFNGVLVVADASVPD
jgi:hypothetical protein